MKKPRVTPAQMIVLLVFGVILGLESLYMVDTLSTWWQLLQRAIHHLHHACLA